MISLNTTLALTNSRLFVYMYLMNMSSHSLGSDCFPISLLFEVSSRLLSRSTRLIHYRQLPAQLLQLAQLARTAHCIPREWGECIWPYQSVLPPSEMSLWRVVTRVGNWSKPPGLNRLKLNEFMPLAVINSILPGLNRFKPVKTTCWHKSS